MHKHLSLGYCFLVLTTVFSQINPPTMTDARGEYELCF